MRVLTKLERNEFELTYNFINFYIGTAASFVKSASEIKINQMPLPYEIIKFINQFNGLKEIAELNLKFKYDDTPLKKINLIFNVISEKRKEIAMSRLIKYCFNNRIQPYKLRIRQINDYAYVSQENNDKPIETEFKNEIDYDDTSFNIVEFEK